MKKTIKFLIVALAFALLLSVSAVAILASDEVTTYTSWVNTSEEADDGALVYDEASGTYKLRGNLTVADTYIFEGDAIIDLNGYTVTITKWSPLVKIAKSSNLTIRGEGTLNALNYAVVFENNGGDTEEEAAKTASTLTIEGFGKGITVNTDSPKNVFQLAAAGAELNVSGKLNIKFSKNGNATCNDTDGSVFNLAHRWTKANISNAEIHVDPSVSGISYRKQIFYLGYATEVNITGSVIESTFGHMFAYKQASSPTSVWGTLHGHVGSADLKALFEAGWDEPTRINVIGSTLVADTYSYNNKLGSASGMLGIGRGYIMFYGENSTFQSSGRMFTGDATYRTAIQDPPGKLYFDGCTFNVLNTDYASAQIFFDHINTVSKNCTFDSLSTVSSQGLWQPNGGYARYYVPLEDANGNAITDPKNFDEQGTGTLILEGCAFPDTLSVATYNFSGITEIAPEYEDCYLYNVVGGKIYVSNSVKVVRTETTVTLNEETGLYETVVTTTTLTPDNKGSGTKTVSKADPTTAATGTVGTKVSNKYEVSSGRIYTLPEGFPQPTSTPKYVWRNGELVQLKYAVVNSKSPFLAAQQHTGDKTTDEMLTYKYVAYYTYEGVDDKGNPVTKNDKGIFLKGETNYHPDNEIPKDYTLAFGTYENGANDRGGIFFQERFTDAASKYSNTYFVLQNTKDAKLCANNSAYAGIATQDAGYGSAVPTSTSYLPNNAYTVTDINVTTLGRNDYATFSYFVRYQTGYDSSKRRTYSIASYNYTLDSDSLTPGEWRHVSFVLEIISKDNADGTTLDLSASQLHVYVNGVYKSSIAIFSALTSFDKTYNIGLDQIRVQSWGQRSDDGTIVIDECKTVYYPKGYTGDITKALADKKMNLTECDDVLYNERYKAPASYSVLVTVGGQAFSNMEDALAYAKTGDEIILFGDAGTTDTPIAVEKDLIINTNGHEFIYTSSSRLSVEYGNEILFKEAEAEDYAYVEWYNYEGELITTDKYIPGAGVTATPNDGKTITNVLEGNNGWYDLKFSHFVDEAGKKPENVLLNKAGTYKFTPAFETPVADVDGIKYNLTTYSYFQYNIYVPTTTPENVTYLGTFSGPNGRNAYNNYGAGTINGVPYNQYCAWPGVANIKDQQVYVRFSVTVGETTTELDYHFAVSIPKYATQVLQNPTMSETALKLVASMANYCNETIKLLNGSYPAEWARAIELAEPYLAASDAYDERIANTAAGTAPVNLKGYLSGVCFLLGEYQPRFAFKYDIAPTEENGNKPLIDHTQLLKPIGSNAAVTRNNKGIYVNIIHKGLVSEDYGAHHYAYKQSGEEISWKSFAGYDEKTKTYNNVYAMSNNTRVFDIDEVLTISVYIDGNAVATGTYSLADYIKYQETVASSTNGTYTAEQIAVAQQTVVASKALYAYAMASEAYKTGN